MGCIDTGRPTSDLRDLHKEPVHCAGATLTHRIEGTPVIMRTLALGTNSREAIARGLAVFKGGGFQEDEKVALGVAVNSEGEPQVWEPDVRIDPDRAERFK